MYLTATVLEKTPLLNVHYVIKHYYCTVHVNSSIQSTILGRAPEVHDDLNYTLYLECWPIGISGVI